MYEDMTFENIMDRCLDRVSSSIDKREGSVVYDAIAPAAAELAIMYIELAYLMDRAFPDTESGDDLTKKVRERSIFRTPATAAIRKGYFEDGNGAAMDVPIGTRFSGDNLNYTVTDALVLNRIDDCLNAVDKVGRRDSPVTIYKDDLHGSAAIPYREHFDGADALKKFDLCFIVGLISAVCLGL